MSVEMKIKACTLAAEARIIRKHERSLLRQARWQKARQGPCNHLYGKYESLNRHRRDTVRRAARLTHLARAYMAGLPYKAVEQPVRKPLTNYHMQQIAKMVYRYGPKNEGGFDAVVHSIEIWIILS